jgi:hypothetical protein
MGNVSSIISIIIIIIFFPTIITASNSNSSKAKHTVKGVREIRGATLVVCRVTLGVILIVGLR